MPARISAQVSHGCVLLLVAGGAISLMLAATVRVVVLVISVWAGSEMTAVTVTVTVGVIVIVAIFAVTGDTAACVTVLDMASAVVSWLLARALLPLVTVMALFVVCTAELRALFC